MRDSDASAAAGSASNLEVTNRRRPILPACGPYGSYTKLMAAHRETLVDLRPLTRGKPPSIERTLEPRSRCACRDEGEAGPPQPVPNPHGHDSCVGPLALRRRLGHRAYVSSASFSKRIEDYENRAIARVRVDRDESTDRKLILGVGIKVADARNISTELIVPVTPDWVYVLKTNHPRVRGRHVERGWQVASENDEGHIGQAAARAAWRSNHDVCMPIPVQVPSRADAVTKVLTWERRAECHSRLRPHLIYA